MWRYYYKTDFNKYFVLFCDPSQPAQYPPQLTPPRPQISSMDHSSTASSSATSAVDPDRQNIQYFEKGGANPQREAIITV